MDYTAIPPDATLEAVAAALKERNFSPIIVNTKEEALETIKQMIPAGASVMNGASRTLEEIGYIEYLKSGAHPWNNLHAGIVAEQDQEKQRTLRRQALLSDYYLGSVHALSEQGELVIASNSGSQLPHLTYSSPKVVLVVSAQKIMPTLAEAEARLKEHVIPLEDARMKEATGGQSGTKLNKLLHFFGEPTYTGRTVTVVLVKEKLGF
jgi:L-lactate utilization protein LutB